MFLRPTAVLALDTGSTTVAVVSPGLGGVRVRACRRVELPPGALVPSPVEPNLRQPEAVVTALRRLVEELGVRRGTLVVPDGAARCLILEAAGAEVSPDYARYRLAPGLPYPAGEAVVDVLPLGRGRGVGAAIRRSVVEEYESAAARAGFGVDRVDLAPLASLAGLVRRPPARGVAVDLILGDSAVSLAVFRDGVLRLLRGRRRDPGPGELARLWEEVERSSALAGEGLRPRVRIVGSGAAALVRELTEAGVSVEPGRVVAHNGLPVDSAELAWLGAVRS
jgi:hypothetical protein